MGFAPEIVVAFTAWRSDGDRSALRDAFSARTASDAVVEPQVGGGTEGLIVQRLSPHGLMAAIDLGARGDAWAIAVCARPVPVIGAVVRRVLVDAKRRPWGLAVRRDHRDPAAEPLAVALNLHTAVIRARRPAAWRAIDAYREHGTATEAAKALGCSTQAVTRQLRESNYKATVSTARLVCLLLETTRNQAAG